nr:MAG TPA: RNA polymerase III-like protein [Caudoviricetes sp.]
MPVNKIAATCDTCGKQKPNGAYSVSYFRILLRCEGWKVGVYATCPHCVRRLKGA